MSLSEKEMKREFEADYNQKAHDEAYNEVMDSIKPLNKYQRHVNSTTIDVYDVLVAFEVNNPATAHAVKKLLASGQRGYKNVIQDLEEAVQSIKRAIDIEKNALFDEV